MTLFLKGNNREKLVRAIFDAASKIRPRLNNDKMLLINQWVDAYSKISRKKMGTP